MATSGSVNFSMNRDEIINAALRKISAVGEGQTATASMITDAAQELNRMVKAWMNQGAHLWTYQDLIVFMTVGQESYNIGSTGDKATSVYVKTELSADAASGASQITVDSAVGITTGDKVGVVLDDGSLHWTTGTVSGSTITLADNLTAAASTDNHVYAYTNIASRPLRISFARMKINDGNEIPMAKVSQAEYMSIPNKKNQGTPTQFFYDKRLTNGKIYLWPAPSSVNDTFHARGEFLIEDFDSVTDEAYFPVEWLNALVYNLAVGLSFEYGALEDETYLKLKDKADYELNQALAFDSDDTYVRIVPASYEGQTWG